MSEGLLDKGIWAAPHVGAWVWVLDPNDTTESPQGSDKRVLLSNLPVDWSNLQNVPTSFACDWNDLTSVPATFPSDWNSISNLPATFPSDWATMVNKPSTFPPDPHTHPPVADVINHAAAGSISLNFSTADFFTVNLTANVTELILLGGNVGQTYGFVLYQGTGAPFTLTMADPYPGTGVTVTQGRRYIGETLDANGYVSRRRVYEVSPSAGYTTVDLATDITAGNLIDDCLFPDGVLPFLSVDEGAADLFFVKVLGTGKYAILQMSSNM